MPSSNAEVKTTKRSLRTTADVRQFIANCMLAVAQGEMKVQEAAVIVKGGEVISTMMYSEVKIRAMAIANNETPAAFGQLLIGKSE